MSHPTAAGPNSAARITTAAITRPARGSQDPRLLRQRTRSRGGLQRPRSVFRSRTRLNAATLGTADLPLRWIGEELRQFSEQKPSDRARILTIGSPAASTSALRYSLAIRSARIGAKAWGSCPAVRCTSSFAIGTWVAKHLNNSSIALHSYAMHLDAVQLKHKDTIGVPWHRRICGNLVPPPNFLIVDHHHVDVVDDGDDFD